MTEPKTETPIIASTEKELPAEDRSKRGGRLDDATALCLSGGGYRAMLFHLGVLWYLNSRGYLKKVDRISSVSGGSLTAGVLGMNWNHLKFDAAGVAANFEELVVLPLRKLAGVTIDRNAIVAGLLTPDSIAGKLIGIFKREVFGAATLQDLPDRPRFVINATNVQSGALFRFSKPYIWDYRVGKIEKPSLSLAAAVAASSAFPPLLSPLTLRFNESDFKPGTGQDLQKPPFTREVVLTDGGVYDNLGIETAWKRFRTILVSDAGGKMEPDMTPKGDWLLHSARIMALIDNQVRSLRKRQLIAAFRAGRRLGAYWGTRSDLRDYKVKSALECPVEKTSLLAAIPTRLESMLAATQEKLINWGFAITDAAMRKHVDAKLSPANEFPYPEAGV